jgi:hypothetical protein
MLGSHTSGITMTPVEEVDFGAGFYTRQVLSFVRAEPVEVPLVGETMRAWQQRLDQEEQRRKEAWARERAESDREHDDQARQTLAEFARAVGLEE